MIVRKIGVDYGTSTSVIHYTDYDNSAKRIIRDCDIPFDGANFSVPTLILRQGSVRDKKGKLKETGEEFGWKAKNKSVFYALICENFKMDLLSRNEEKRKSGQDLTRRFFKYLYEQYDNNSEDVQGSRPEKVITYVTYPAKFSDDARGFLCKAAEEAGFPNVQTISEAEAAMQYAVRTETSQKSSVFSKVAGSSVTVMLIDMGAGTTDIAIYSYNMTKEGEHKLLGYYPKNGERNFGGREIDDLLCEFYKSRLGDEVCSKLGYGDVVLGNHLLLNDVKMFKQTNISSELLSEDGTVDALPDSLNFCWNGQDTDIDRRTFETLLKDYMPQFPALVNGALESAGLTGAQIDLVILTGGHSNWYFVKDMLLGKNGCPIDLPKVKESKGECIISFGENAQMVVARGAARYEKFGKNPDMAETKEVFAHKPQESVFPLKYVPHSRIRPVIACGDYHTVGVRQNGTALAVGKKTDGILKVDAWSNIVAVAASSGLENGQFIGDNYSASFGGYTAGLRKDGTIVTVGSRTFRDACLWQDIVAIAGGFEFIVGLNQNGRVVTDGWMPPDLSKWEDITSIAAYWNQVVGVKATGEVVFNNSAKVYYDKVSKWNNIVAVAAGTEHIVGLKVDGSVVAAGLNLYGECNVDMWRDIVAIAAGGNSTVGLKRDGSVVVAGRNSRCKVSSWQDITAIACGGYHIMGLKRDGTVIVSLYKGFSGLGVTSKIVDTNDWRLF